MSRRSRRARPRKAIRSLTDRSLAGAARRRASGTSLLAQTERSTPMLPDFTILGLFVLASLALLVTPGPAVLYIIARSVQQGRAAGLVSVLGIHLATSVHVAAA